MKRIDAELTTFDGSFVARIDGEDEFVIRAKAGELAIYLRMNAEEAEELCDQLAEELDL